MRVCSSFSEPYAALCKPEGLPIRPRGQIRIRERHQSKEADKTETQAKRDQQAGEVPESSLPLYDRLMKSKNGLAISEMKDGTCEGCHMKLIASTVAAVQSEKEVTRCENCGRILYTS